MAGATIAVGFTLPYWLRNTMMLTGISCKDEMLRIRNIHISLVATPLCGLILSRAFIALIPDGVAAHPSPRRLATIFVLMYSFASLSLNLGNRSFKKGAMSLSSFFTRPKETATFIIPDHTPTTPNIRIQSCTASLEESRIVSDTAFRLPFILPINIPAKIKILHI